MKVKKYIIFDLDDTLFCEIDYLKSAYKELANFVDKENEEVLYNEMIANYKREIDVFGILEKKYKKCKKSELLKKYREHNPNITLNEGVLDILDYCRSKGYKLGIITDGRSITQRKKIVGLGIEHYFDKIIISEEFGSEKPNLKNYEVFLHEDIEEYFYIGDNISKDFITPNKIEWKTVVLLDNKDNNIHIQSFDFSDEYLPKYQVSSMKELINIIS